ncbi:hypothetical protein ACIRP3_05135 [Streptomyces sp. NPDC101209]|uniref:hypothetical protein n=1 Tax=Streptomyces TaxID=1883 RepID=UPI00201CBEFD|nr:hypothetical protein [Streptomyces panaciradicis]MCL6675274.1 hypothetical protein [Streptomyces panaciradicis]
MISTRRIAAAVGLAAGITGLAAPMAGAAPAVPNPGRISPMATLDSLAVSDVPREHVGEMPRPSDQLQRLNDLNQLHQVTDLAAPLLPLLGAVH